MTLGEGETALSYSDIENKTVFFMGNASLADRAEHKKGAKVYDALSTYTYVFNLDNPLFAIKEVRQALSKVIDRNSIIDAITFGKAATGLLPDSVRASNGKTFSDDLISTVAAESEAQSLINSVSSKLAGLDKNITLTVNDDEESLAIAGIVKSAWEKLGFAVTVEAVGSVRTEGISEEPFYDSEIQVLAKKAARGERDFDVIAVDWQAYSADPFVALAAFSVPYSGCGLALPEGAIHYGSFGGYADESYDSLIASAYNAKDDDEREGYLKEAEAELVNSACVVPLVFNQNFAFVSKDLSGVEADGFGNFLFTETKQKNYKKYLE
jgi:ABC-type transport system substrate-binding protein